MVSLAKSYRDEAVYHFERSMVCADKVLDVHLRVPWWDFLRSNSELTRSGDEVGYPVVEDRRSSRNREKPTASLGSEARKVSIKAAGYAAYLAAGLSMGSLAIVGGRYLSVQQRRLIRQLESFIDLYNLIEYASSAAGGRQGNYLVLNSSSPTGPYRRFWLDNR
jgi:hypothetical protein